MKNKIKFFPFELAFWMIGLLFLAISNPFKPHFSFCLLQKLGFSWCLGCGIGKSVSFLLHGEIIKSFQTHYLGTFALAVIVHRIIKLIINLFKTQKNGQSIFNA